MTQACWHLDVAWDDAGASSLVVYDPEAPMLIRAPISRAGRNEIVGALLDIMRTTLRRPEVIVTDRAQTWASVAPLVDAEHRYVQPGEMSLAESLARKARLSAGFSDAQRKFQRVRAEAAEDRADKLEQLLRQMLGAQIVQPYRGWDLTALNRAVDCARQFLRMPSIRDLNPSIAKMQDAAIANGLTREARP